MRLIEAQLNNGKLQKVFVANERIEFEYDKVIEILADTASACRFSPKCLKSQLEEKGIAIIPTRPIK